jgi:hypothetical protein
VPEISLNRTLAQKSESLWVGGQVDGSGRFDDALSVVGGHTRVFT